VRLAGLEGLAAKHGRCAARGLRSRGARPACEARGDLVAEPGGVRLEVLDPERATLPLTRRRVSPRLWIDSRNAPQAAERPKIRTSEPGLRAALQPVPRARFRCLVLEARAGPVGGSDGEAIELPWASTPRVASWSRQRARSSSSPRSPNSSTAVPAALGAARELARRRGSATSATRAAPRARRGPTSPCALPRQMRAQPRLDIVLFARVRGAAATGARAGTRGPRLRARDAYSGGFAPPRRRARDARPPTSPSRAAAPRRFAAEPRAAGPTATEPGGRALRARARAPLPSSGRVPRSARFEEVSLFDLDEDAPDAAPRRRSRRRRRAAGGGAAAPARAARRRGRGDGPRAIARAATTAAARRADRSGPAPTESRARRRERRARRSDDDDR
jgi:hypothetical protein